MDELQLHDLHMADAAVPPARVSHPSDNFYSPMKIVHAEHTDDARPPAPAKMGIESSAPILQMERWHTVQHSLPSGGDWLYQSMLL